MFRLLACMEWTTVHIQEKKRNVEKNRIKKRDRKWIKEKKIAQSNNKFSVCNEQDGTATRKKRKKRNVCDQFGTLVIFFFSPFLCVCI